MYCMFWFNDKNIEAENRLLIASHGGGRDELKSNAQHEGILRVIYKQLNSTYLSEPTELHTIKSKSYLILKINIKDLQNVQRTQEGMEPVTNESNFATSGH
jgi:hypothetical protein